MYGTVMEQKLTGVSLKVVWPKLESLVVNSVLHGTRTHTPVHS
jgi:hypothetical protein